MRGSIMRRTKNHIQANELDLEVYRLMRRAADICDAMGDRADKKRYQAWTDVWEHLRHARSVLRGKLMHPDEVEDTG